MSRWIFNSLVAIATAYSLYVFVDWAMEARPESLAIAFRLLLTSIGLGALAMAFLGVLVYLIVLLMIRYSEPMNEDDVEVLRRSLTPPPEGNPANKDK